MAPKETSAHRRQRRLRSAQRLLVRLTSAAPSLEAHHGSRCPSLLRPLLATLRAAPDAVQVAAVNEDLCESAGPEVVQDAGLEVVPASVQESEAAPLQEDLTLQGQDGCTEHVEALLRNRLNVALKVYVFLRTYATTDCQTDISGDLLARHHVEQLVEGHKRHFSELVRIMSKLATTTRETEFHSADHAKRVISQKVDDVSARLSRLG